MAKTVHNNGKNEIKDHAHIINTSGISPMKYMKIWILR